MATNTAFRKVTPLLLTAMLAAGCATPMPTQHQAGLGRIAVVASPHDTEIKFDGLDRGDLAAEGIRCLRFLFALVAPPVAVAALAGCAALVGVVTAAPPSEDEIRAAGKQADLATQSIQDSLQNQVAAAMHSRGARIARIPLERAQRAAQSRDYRTLSAEGIDSVLETSVTRLGTRSMRSATPMSMLTDPPLLLYLQARVRLIRTADNAEMLSREFEYHGRRRKHSEWLAVGKDIAREVEAGYQPLGEYISDTVQLLYSFPDQNTLLPTLEFGLDLVGPTTFLGRIDTLQPTLQWQRFPRESDLKASPADMARVKDVTYELILAAAEYGVPATIVYRREGLSESAHQLPTPLAPGTNYIWTVRARFQLDGRQRVTEWASTRHGENHFGSVAPPAFGYRFWTKSAQ